MEKEGLADQWSELIKSSGKENLWHAKQDYSIGFPDCALYSSFFFFSFRSHFIQSPRIKPEPFPPSWGSLLFVPPTVAFLPSSRRTEAQSQEKSSWILSLQELPQILCQRPCCSPSALSPFSSSPTRPDSHLPWNISGFWHAPPPALLPPGKHARFPEVMSVFPTSPSWTYKHCPSAALHE